MDMTQLVEKDEYDWMLVSYGEDYFENEKKQCREEGERNGFVKGFAEGFMKGVAKGAEEKFANRYVEEFANEFAEEFAKWFAKVFAEILAEKCDSIALNMLKSNYPLEEISKLTKLDLARIHQLAKYNKLE